LDHLVLSLLRVVPAAGLEKKSVEQSNRGEPAGKSHSSMVRWMGMIGQWPIDDAGRNYCTSTCSRTRDQRAVFVGLIVAKKSLTIRATQTSDSGSK
jgi:hypothetical protein